MLDGPINFAVKLKLDLALVETGDDKEVAGHHFIGGG
jgi:hypothetical protein